MGFLDIRYIILAAALIAVTASGSTRAQAEDLDGAKLFQEKTCIACHGPDAKTPILPNYPRLAGQNYEYMIQQIMDIKSGARSNGQTAAMKAVLPIASDAELEAIARYISTLPR